MQLAGIHHLTAVTADIAENYAFYTRTLGLRLVKKSVNQDDVTAYHLFYADGVGSPGTDLTFFDWMMPREHRGTCSVVRAGLRVAREADLCWWEERLHAAGVVVAPIQRIDGRLVLPFEDGEGQRLCLVTTEAVAAEHPWRESPVPVEHQILGLGPVMLSVPELGPTAQLLMQLMAMREVRGYELAGRPVHVFAMGEGGPAAELHVVVEPGSAPARLGAGSVHHVAFRTTLADYAKWFERLAAMHIRNSGPVDRFYFKSLYFREPNGILFELATDEPGFTADEPLEKLGGKLALPPFLEARRTEIEAGLKPLV